LLEVPTQRKKGKSDFLSRARARENFLSPSTKEEVGSESMYLLPKIYRSEVFLTIFKSPFLKNFSPSFCHPPPPHLTCYPLLLYTTLSLTRESRYPGVYRFFVAQWWRNYFLEEKTERL
jgi:hypothetical protein